MNNCPNCGAPLDPYVCKCPYCGTLYFDLATLNLEDGSPCFVKFKTPRGLITMLARPELQTMEMYSDECYAVDRCGIAVSSYMVSKRCDLNAVFHALVDPESGELFRLEVEV